MKYESTCAIQFPSLFCLVVVLLACIDPSAARITEASVSRDDRNTILIARPFGFAAGGRIDIELSNQTLYRTPGSPKPDASKLGIFITKSEPDSQVEPDLGSDGTCILESKQVSTLFTFQEISTLKDGDVVKYSNRISDEYAGVYSLFFANCLEETVVSFNIRVSLYNIDSDGDPNFLSVGESELPVIYMTMFVLFTVAGACWTALVVKNRANAHRIHVLMILLVVLKAMTLLSQAGMYHLIKTTGHPDGWNIAFYVFTFFRGIFFFTTVVLVGTGWSYMKPFLAEREKKILMAVIPLQVVANIAIVVLDENTPATRNWFTWQDMFHLLDIICCCAILFPIVWSIKHLREASQADGKAAANLEKLTLFRHFYVVVVSYIYFTRIVVFLLKSTMPYEYEWMSCAAGEVATLAFYVVTGMKFKPYGSNPYFALDSSEAGDSNAP